MLLVDCIHKVYGIRKYNRAVSSNFWVFLSFQVGARKAWQSQSFGAVGDDRVTPVTLAHKRINSASLINIGEGNGATGISHVEDPFPGAPQSTSSNNDNWATFSTTPTLATPAGSPSLKSEDSAWADPGWVKQTSTLDTWSSFESSSASQVRTSARSLEFKQFVFLITCF